LSTLKGKNKIFKKKKLCWKQYYDIELLRWIVAPQLIGGLQHDYSTKTRQVGHEFSDVYGLSEVFNLATQQPLVAAS
jgi:hypothetical protein